MPVLSVAMCVVEPRVSTAESCLMIAPRFARRLAPIARVNATTAVRPSGIVATARDTAMSSSSVQDCPRTSPSTKTMPTTTNAMIVSNPARRSIRRCSGVRPSWAVPRRPAIAPICVSMPVAVTTMTPRPRVIAVFMKTMLDRSPRGASGSVSGAGSLSTGWASPVKDASAACSRADSRSRPSAGTESPASSSTMSPGTSSARSTWASRPSRRTREVLTDIFRSAASELSARVSCT